MSVVQRLSREHPRLAQLGRLAAYPSSPKAEVVDTHHADYCPVPALHRDPSATAKSIPILSPPATPANLPKRYVIHKFSVRRASSAFEAAPSPANWSSMAASHKYHMTPATVHGSTAIRGRAAHMDQATTAIMKPRTATVNHAHTRCVFHVCVLWNGTMVSSMGRILDAAVASEVAAMRKLGCRML